MVCLGTTKGHILFCLKLVLGLTNDKVTIGSRRM